MENWIEHLIAKWKSEGVKLNPPATIAEIENTEAVLKFKFPEDFKEFYLQVNGFGGLDWQEHMFTFWPLDMISEEFKTSTNKNFIGFSDFLLASHFIGFNREKLGIFKLFHNDDVELVADTFHIAVDMVNSGSDPIY